jgi:hypothetical protein
MKLTTTDSNNQKISVPNQTIRDLNLSLKETVLTLIREIGFELHSIEDTTTVYKNPNIDNTHIRLNYINENHIISILTISSDLLLTLTFQNNLVQIKVGTTEIVKDMEFAFNLLIQTIRKVWNSSKGIE